MWKAAEGRLLAFAGRQRLRIDQNWRSQRSGDWQDAAAGALRHAARLMRQSLATAAAVRPGARQAVDRQAPPATSADDCDRALFEDIVQAATMHYERAEALRDQASTLIDAVLADLEKLRSELGCVIVEPAAARRSAAHAVTADPTTRERAAA